ncbi:hypothetical protein PYJP_11180 [Pyrofollis japonicus]|jgi:hypothetical protein|uniref:hypothetical protein n=1 Tax=Pyrofollis japonicus TaxID=3060460 RepID=UPI00295BA0C8|nr:hypothetical protein [Pyrofollis japonicus]BEP17766.1 hypothetical protein PYJP_11180 [Pyrofollis japonicus]
MPSEYLSKVKDLIKPKLEEKGLKALLVGSTLKLVKDGDTVMNISDKGEIVELSFKGKKYTYDKWYTKPEHLAKTITVTLDAQL